MEEFQIYAPDFDSDIDSSENSQPESGMITVNSAVTTPTNSHPTPKVDSASRRRRLRRQRLRDWYRGKSTSANANPHPWIPDPKKYSDIVPNYSNLDNRRCYFRGAHSPLSNFFPCDIKFRGKVYKSVEHAYQCMKAQCVGNKIIENLIFNAPNAAAAKRIANKLDYSLASTKLWFQHRVAVMKEILQQKYDQVPEFRAALKVKLYFVENTPDRFWAAGFYRHDYEARSHGPLNGRNVLGSLLTKLAFTRSLTTRKKKSTHITDSLVPRDVRGPHVTPAGGALPHEHAHGIRESEMVHGMDVGVPEPVREGRHLPHPGPTVETPIVIASMEGGLQLPVVDATIKEVQPPYAGTPQILGHRGHALQRQ